MASRKQGIGMLALNGYLLFLLFCILCSFTSSRTVDRGSTTDNAGAGCWAERWTRAGSGAGNQFGSCRSG
jgi:hypothetical protein